MVVVWCWLFAAAAVVLVVVVVGGIFVLFLGLGCCYVCCSSVSSDS